MRVTFVGIGWEQLGVGLLSAIARQRGHRVSLAFSPALFNDRAHLNIPALARMFDDRRELMQTIERQRPDVVAFSALTGTVQWMLSIAEQTKQLFPDCRVVFGGVHASALPERVLARRQVDYVCVGEGDVAFAQILDAVAAGDDRTPIVNTRFKSTDGDIITGLQAGFIQDLDALPFFDKRLWEGHIAMEDSYITMASRGCPYRCAFCFNSFFADLPQENRGKYVRRRSVEHMMAELLAAKRRYRLRMIEFFDDVFTLDKAWLKTFLQRYRTEISVPFQCFTHVKSIDEDVARWLADAGCFSSQIGVQSMSDDYKRKQVNRFESAADVEKTIRLFRKYGIRAKFDHMFGLPGEEMEAQETARAFYAESPPYSIQTYWTNYFPGTELLRKAVASGRLSKQAVEMINEGISCDIYSNSNKNVDSAKLRLYHSYQLIFKLLPHLPRVLRKRLRPEPLARLPVGVCMALSFLADVIIGLLKWSPDHILYARHYVRHMTRLVSRRLRGMMSLNPVSARSMAAGLGRPGRADERQQMSYANAVEKEEAVTGV